MTKKLECVVVSKICTVWPLRFCQENFILNVMQPMCCDMPILFILRNAVSAVPLSSQV